MIPGRLVLRGACAALLVLSCAFAPAASAAEAPLETFAASGTPGFTSADPLVDGHVYVVSVRGTFSPWSAASMSTTPPGRVVCGAPEDAPMFTSPGTTNGRVSNDAEFYFARSVVGSTCTGSYPQRGSSLRFSTDGGTTFRSVAPLTAPSAPTAGHNYSYAVTGSGQPLQVQVADVNYRDNFGQLRVDVIEDAAPVLSTSGGSAAFVEAGSAVPVDPGLTLSDADSTTIRGATVKVTNAPSSGEDRLALPATPGITASYDAATATLTLKGNRPVADYQAALRSVTYEDVSQAPTTTTRHVSFTATDLEGATSSAAARDVTVGSAALSERRLESFAPKGAPAPLYTSPAALSSGQSYLVKVRGTFSPWSAADISASPPAGRIVCGTPENAPMFPSPETVNGRVADDPEFRFARSVAGSSCSDTFPFALPVLRFSTNGGSTFTQITPVGGAPSAPDPGHSYSYLVTGAGQPLQVKIEDAGQYFDNAGQFRVVLDAAPVITTSLGSAAFIENAAPVPADPGLTLTDTDSTDIASAQVVITGAPATTEDRLALPATPGITATYDQATSILSLTGTRPVADYQAALRSVTYNNISDTPNTTTRNLAFTATDTGGATSQPASRSVTVTAVADPPVVTTTSGSGSYTENAAATVVDSALTVSDPDSATLKQATVTIASGARAGDRLTIGNAQGLTVAGSGTNTLTLTGTASPATYAAALRTIAFDNSGDDPGSATRTIRFVATDSENTDSNPADRQITVTPVNDPPATDPTDSAASALEQVATAVDPGIVVTDPDSPNLKGATVQITNNFQSGQDTLQFTNQNGITGTVSGNLLTLTGSATVAQYQTALRSVTYTNTSDAPNTSTREITFRVSDDETPSLLSTAQTRNLNVVPVNDAPTDTGESADATGNTRLEVELTSGGSSLPKRTSGTGNLLDNSTDPDDAASALSVDTATVSDPPHGTVTVNPDGSYVYTPDVGYTGPDSFTYKVKDDENAQSATSTVSITVANRVWYVKNDFVGASDGRSQTPFTTLAAADTAANATGDTIYVLRGTGTAGLTDTVDLLANQRLIGEAQSLVVPGNITLFTGTPANRPPLTGTVNLNDGNTISGVAIAGSGAPAIGGATGHASGTIADVQLSGASGGLDLSIASGTWNISDLTVSTTGGTAVNLNNAGTVNFTPAGTISLASSGGPALTAAGTGVAPTSLSGTIDSVTTTSSPSGISMTATTGSLTIDDVNLSTTGTALTLNNANNVTINNSGDADITSTGTAVNLINGPTTQPNAPDVALDQVSSSGGTTGINIDSIGAGTFSANGGTLSGQTANAIDINGGSGDITYPGTLGNGSGNTADITGRSGGAIALGGNINDSNDAAGGITMSGNSGGSTTFSGTTKTLNTGASAAFSSTGSGHTISFTGGGLDIDTTTGTGFNATGGGTVTVQGSGNTIDAVSATALNVVNTSIGAGNLNFLRVSSGNATAAADPTNGIVVNNTGSSGGLITNGDGGGSSNGSGGVVQNTVGTGVVLTSTNNVSLGYVNVINSGDDGIHANGVTNFAMNRSNVNNNGNSTSDDGLQFGEASGNQVGVLGTVSITNSSVSANAHNGFWLRNPSGTLSSFTVSGSTFNDVNDTTGANAFLFEGSGTSTMTSGSISGNTFQNNSPQRALEVQAHDTATVGTMTVSGNTFVNNGIQASFTQDTVANLTFKFINNGTAATPMTASTLQNVNVFSSSQSTGGTLTGTISGNRIGNPAVAGSAGGAAITGVIQGQTKSTLLIDGNIVRQTSGDARAIGLSFRGVAPPAANTIGPNTVVNDLTITNNDVVPGAAPSGFPLAAIMVEADNQSGADNKSPTVRADIRNNTVPSTQAFDLVGTEQLQFYEYDAAGGHGIGQLVDTAPASASATAQLTSTNTGTASAFGISLIPGPITTPP